MRIHASVAVTADGYIDDATPQRLLISTREDMQEVYRLRTLHDAILVGAETLRRDDPSLLLRDEAVRQQRTSRGLKPDIAKVTVTRSGDLNPALRFFTAGDACRYVFSPEPLPALDAKAEIIVADEPITAALIVTELEKRGIGSLFVEGGARTLALFAREGLLDTLRIARNPALRVGGGVRLELPEALLAAPHLCESRFGMDVSCYTFHPDRTEEDLRCLGMAIAESRRCTPGPTSYCVGAVVRTCDGQLFTGFTHETSPTHHAEQEAIAKALAAGARLQGASIWSSMEPCSRRSSEPESCSQLILRHGFSHVAFALYEPDRFVQCRGALDLRLRGVDVRAYPELGDQVVETNAHLLR